MKLLTISLVGSALIAGAAFAKLGEPINTGRIADVSGKRADLPMAEMNTIDLPGTTQPRSNITRQRYNTRVVPMNTVNQPTVSTPIVGTEIRPTPLANFGPKRPAVSDDRVPAETVTMETVATGKAPITNRVIRVNTPAGEAELVQELKPGK
jgi:hypothetical protein